MESLDEETWDEETARLRERRDWIIFWVVAILCGCLFVAAIIYKEVLLRRLHLDTPTPTPTSVATAAPPREVSIFPDPQVPSDEIDTGTYNFDLNADGVVSEEEAKAGYKTFDKNGNGVIDGQEILELRMALRHTNGKLLEREMDINKDGKISVGERWHLLQPFDSNHDGELSSAELKAFWEDFVKKHYSGRAWELLSGDATQALAAVQEYIKTHSQEGHFVVEKYSLKYKEAASFLADVESMVIRATFELDKSEATAKVDFFLERSGADWKVVAAWITEPPPYRCPKHRLVVSPRKRNCPFDNLPMKQ